MSQAELPTTAAAHSAGESDPFQDEPMLGFRSRSYRLFELVDDVLHIGVAALLVVIAVIVFAHIILTGLSDLDVGNTSAVKFFDVILNDINTILFVVIVLELLATVIAHLRERVFDLRPLLIIGVISSVRHILIVTAHMSADTAADPGPFTQQIVELLVNTVVTLVLVLCLWYISRADQLLKRGHPSGE
jgi:uncharacterized membrane protein (DUF373 family)